MTTEKSPYTKSLANVIKAERVRAGFTQVQLADRSGLARVTIARLEGALRAPDTEQLEAIAAVFGRSPSWMLLQAEEHVEHSGH